MGRKTGVVKLVTKYNGPRGHQWVAVAGIAFVVRRSPELALGVVCQQLERGEGLERQVLIWSPDCHEVVEDGTLPTNPYATYVPEVLAVAVINLFEQGLVLDEANPEA